MASEKTQREHEDQDIADRAFAHGRQGAAPEEEAERVRRAAELETLRVERAEVLALQEQNTQFTLAEHGKQLKSIDTGMTAMAKDIHGLRNDLGNVPFDLSPVTTAMQTFTKGLEKIEEREIERAKEAREDRRSVKVALYSFVTAIVASGVGALILHFIGAL
jgi:hypothetical protein